MPATVLSTGASRTPGVLPVRVRAGGQGWGSQTDSDDACEESVGMRGTGRHGGVVRMLVPNHRGPRELPRRRGQAPKPGQTRGSPALPSADGPVTVTRTRRSHPGSSVSSEDKEGVMEV